MSITEGFEARCSTCQAEYNESLIDPSKHQANRQIVNRDIWMKTHYEVHGHHRFTTARVTQREVSVAVIHDPNQGRLSDDPNYSTIRLGGDDVQV